MPLYRSLLRLFPAPFRARFGADLEEAFRDRLNAARRRGPAAVVVLWLSTLRDVIHHGLAERRLARGLAPRLGDALMTSLWQDLRYGWRFFARRPGFTALAVLTLALGIGANTAIFSVVKSVLLEPLPYRDVDRLVMIWRPGNPDGVTNLSLREVLGYRAEASGFDDVAAYTGNAANFTGGDEPERVRAAAVTSDLLDVLGAVPAVGRSFVAADAEPGAPEVIVLGHALWQRRFGADASIVGTTIPVNGRPRTVVGIMPPAFRLPLDFHSAQPTEAFVPVRIDPANPGSWGDRSYLVVGRLATDVTPEAATGALHAVSRRWIEAGYMMDNGDGRLFRSAVPLQEFVTGGVRRPMLVLSGAVGFVLLIACANVINLLLTKAELRRREVGVRMALGASRRQILRQMLVESVVLAAAGGLAGLAVAYAGLHALVSVRPVLVPRVAEASIDPSVLAFTAGLSLLAAVAFGLVPAVRLSRSTTPMVNSGRGAGSGSVRIGVRRILVVAEFASAVVLVVGAGLLVRTFGALQRVDLGFDPRGVLTAQIQVSPTSAPNASDVVPFYQRLIARLETLPGVTAAGAIRLLPLTRTMGNWSITVEGAPRAPGDNPNGDFQWVTPGYFAAMRTPLVRGRFFTDADREDALPVVLVNETMAARYWPGQDALGRRFKMGTADQPWMTIVGILGRTHHNGFDELPRAEMYLPHAQLPQTVGNPARGMALVMKTDGDPMTLARPLRDVIKEMDPNLPVADIRSLEQITRDALSETRFAMLLLACFAGLALALAAIGVYGTLSVLVSERATEIGIRMALGATPRVIVRMVLGQGLALAAAGVCIGVAGAVALTRLLDTLVFGVSTLDPATFAAVPVLLAAVAGFACVWPARRAAAVDPIATLRS
jgi:putative ABC transport system permease protein